MNKNTLIAYCTKHGSVKNCAVILSEKIEGKADIKNLKETVDIDLSQYDNVIIGGSIYMGRIQKEVSEFCSKNSMVLTQKNVGLFICCMNNKEAQVQLNNSFPQELLIHANAKDCFGGELILNKMNFFERFITKMVSKKLSKSDESLVRSSKNKDASTISMESIDKFVQKMMQ